MHYGTRAVGSTIDIYVTTHAQTGASVAPNSAFEAADFLLYKNGSATQRSSTAGWTITSPFDSITGLHCLTIDLSDNTDAGFYAAGARYALILSPDETIDGLATVREVAAFDIGVPPANVTQLLGTAWLTPGTAGTPDVNAKLWNALTTVALPLVPTTAGRTLDVSAGGEAGVDWANVGGKTTANDLTGTNIKTDQVVASVSGAVGSVTGLTAATVHADLDDIQARLPAALTANGNIKADTLRVAGTVQTAGDLAAAIDAVDNFIDTEVAAIKAVTDLLPDAGALTSLATQASVNTIDDFLDTEIAAILLATGTTLDDMVDDLEGRLTAALATQLAAHSLGVGRGVFEAGCTTTALVIKTVNGAAGSAVDDFYNGRHIVITSGALLLQATSISDYVGATKTLTVPALTGAPADTVTFIIV